MIFISLGIYDTLLSSIYLNHNLDIKEETFDLKTQKEEIKNRVESSYLTTILYDNNKIMTPGSTLSAPPVHSEELRIQTKYNILLKLIRHKVKITEEKRSIIDITREEIDNIDQIKLFIEPKYQATDLLKFLNKEVEDNCYKVKSIYNREIVRITPLIQPPYIQALIYFRKALEVLGVELKSISREKSKLRIKDTTPLINLHSNLDEESKEELYKIVDILLCQSFEIISSFNEKFQPVIINEIKKLDFIDNIKIVNGKGD